MRKMKSILAVSMGICLWITSNIGVLADEPASQSESLKTLAEGEMEYVELTECESIPVDKLENTEYNKTDRGYTGPLDEIINVPSELGVAAQADNDNTDPNYAYIAQNNTVMQGTIEAENEFRWYAFILNEKSKATIELQMVQNLDADLYLFRLNGSQLEVIGGSAIEGAGVSEIYTEVFDAGVYFFAVAGYKGTGNFAFAYFESTADAAYEINDSAELASEIQFDQRIVGVIDHPRDVDFYKLTVSESAVVKYSFTTSDGYKFVIAKAGQEKEPMKVSEDMVIFAEGTYYFAVYSQDASFSTSSTYTIDINKIGNAMADDALSIIAISEETGIIFQTNLSGTAYYVNGHPININYHWQDQYLNPEGSQVYDIQIQDSEEVFIGQRDENDGPRVAGYETSTHPNITVSPKAVLELTFGGPEGFYYIHCRCTGAYSANNCWRDYNWVRVIIDPETGTLIDIVDFNYFYDYAAGSNYISLKYYPFKDMVLYKRI